MLNKKFYSTTIARKFLPSMGVTYLPTIKLLYRYNSTVARCACAIGPRNKRLASTGHGDFVILTDPELEPPMIISHEYLRFSDLFLSFSRSKFLYILKLWRNTSSELGKWIANSNSDLHLKFVCKCVKLCL